MRSRVIRMVVLAASFSVVAVAHGAPGLVIGVDDDNLKWTDNTGGIVGVQRDIGFSADRVTLQWQPGRRMSRPATS